MNTHMPFAWIHPFEHFASIAFSFLSLSSSFSPHTHAHTCAHMWAHIHTCMATHMHTHTHIVLADHLKVSTL